MGTRNLTIVINKVGAVKVAQYVQWDGYPSGQGITVLNFLEIKKNLINLKNELAELKQKAIVPKFRIGQEVWFISDPNIEENIARYSKVRHIKIEEISISSIFIERGVMYAGGDLAGISESELFATKEEAEQKLAEMKGEKDA